MRADAVPLAAKKGARWRLFCFVLPDSLHVSPLGIFYGARKKRPQALFDGM